MKSLAIIFKDILDFAKQRTVIFIILVISLVISIYSFFFLSSTAMNEVDSYNVSIGAKDRYYISNHKQNMNEEKIKEFIKYVDEHIISNIYRVYSNPTLVKKGEKASGVEYENFTQNMYSTYQVCIGTNKNNNVMKDYIGRLLNEEDIEKCSRYILIGITDSISMEDNFILHKEIKFNKHNYVVQAIDKININSSDYIEKSTNFSEEEIKESMIEFGYIPITTFFLDKYPISGLEIILPNGVSKEDRVKFEKELTNRLEDYEIQFPIREDTANLRDINFQIIVYSLFLLISMVNIIALFKYGIEKNWRKYMIYRICGATKIQIYKIVIGESSIITIFTSIISIILYYMTSSLYKYIGINYILKLDDIMVIVTLTILIVFINTHLLANKISKIEARYIGRK